MPQREYSAILWYIGGLLKTLSMVVESSSGGLGVILYVGFCLTLYKMSHPQKITERMSTPALISSIAPPLNNNAEQKSRFQYKARAGGLRGVILYVGFCLTLYKMSHPPFINDAGG